MHTLVFLILGCGFISAANSQQKDSQKSLEETADQKIKVFATELKHTLVAAIQKDGLLSAVEICRQKAPGIGESLSNDDWTVARTSSKIGNGSNQPDQWEKQVLIDFDKCYKSGEKATTLTASIMDKEQFRFMKAIPTGQVCLACHGSSVDTLLLKSINATYPEDHAVGFTVQDIRGAYTLTKKLHKAL